MIIEKFKSQICSQFLEISKLKRSKICDGTEEMKKEDSNQKPEKSKESFAESFQRKIDKSDLPQLMSSFSTEANEDDLPKRSKRFHFHSYCSMINPDSSMIPHNHDVRLSLNSFSASRKRNFSIKRFDDLINCGWLERRKSFGETMKKVPISTWKRADSLFLRTSTKNESIVDEVIFQ